MYLTLKFGRKSTWTKSLIVTCISSDIFDILTWLYILYKTKEQIKFIYASTNKKISSI